MHFQNRLCLRYTGSMPLRLGPVARARAAFHILRTGDYEPASAYLHGVRTGLDKGLAIAWDEFQRRFPDIGAPPQVRAASCVSPFLEP